MFDSFPDYSDNSRAMSNFLILHSNYQLIWAVKDINKYKNTSRIKFVGKMGLLNRLMYNYYSMRSAFLFSTHGAYPYANSSCQTFFCFWHGTPLKKIGKLQEKNQNSHYMEQCDLFCSPSDFYNQIIAKAFGKTETNILTTGYPRIDFLFQETNCLEQLGINLGINKLVVYLPTFRTPLNGGYVDSQTNVFEEQYINFNNDADLDNWNNYFKSQQIVLLVKPHPSDSSIICSRNLSNIKVVRHQTLLDKDIQLYHILHYASALLTDYSSVYCDFLVLDRPMGFILSDMEEYNSNRGLVFENPIDYLPGTIIFAKSDFKKFFENIAVSLDGDKSKRQSLMDIYLKYNDNNNCQRIASSLGLKTND
jgi:CDP-glycerol glycerophosphotransferase (TagB/SpsB family)